MSKPELHQKTEIEDSNSLKGTLISVSVVGLVILFTWFGVWNLFLTR
ncbi:hypothetical protein [Calidifontibacillus oryziterrae]|nr:hypothetical protein [Calidifontibacillus oryziterrae]